ncbi:MAG: glycine cleavage system protein H [Candidatus Deferrimicrobiaceae bacterium]
MGGFSFVDIYATKGLEYLIVIGFLATFVLFCRYLALRNGETAEASHPAEFIEWFRVPGEFLYHQGHGWAKAGNEGVVTVGLDDFAQKLVGKVDFIDLPSVGSRLAQGEKGWVLRAGAQAIPMLSPLDGEVVAVNEEAARSPEIVNEDPFGKGWLLKVRPARLAANRTNLLKGRLARKWTEEALHGLRHTMGGNLGPLHQDGGTTLPVHQKEGAAVLGIARAMYGEGWATKVREQFLTEGTAGGPSISPTS